MRLTLNEVISSKWVQGEIPSSDQIIEYMEILNQHVQHEKNQYAEMM